jgi:MoaA/NifB/PqqE/SkfB family radical SAM enzyme
MLQLKPKVDIIYNITPLCQWDCKVCCVDAIQVSREKNKVIVRSDSLINTESFEIKNKPLNPYQEVTERRQTAKLELNYDEKLKILENLSEFDAKLDISGGDPLIVDENYKFTVRAAQQFGRENITLTATGRGLTNYKPEQLVPYIGEFNFTFDAESSHDVINRPFGYANGNLRFANKMALLGCNTRAEFPLNKLTATTEHIERLYIKLHKLKIQKLLLMRLFPVGRGAFLEDSIPSIEQYTKVIMKLRELENRYQYPKVSLQCALKHLEDSKKKSTSNPCDIVRESFGLMSDGTLLASPWAINAHGKPLSEEWVLGNLLTNNLGEILQSEKAKVFLANQDKNYGHCKIFAFIYSNHKNLIDRIFDKSDPIYI